MPSFGDPNAARPDSRPGAGSARLQPHRPHVHRRPLRRHPLQVLHKTGFASQPSSTSRDDGLTLHGAYITAAATARRPATSRSPEEIRNCRPYLERELDLLTDVKVVVALGKIAFDNYLDVLKSRGVIASRAAFAFGHDRAVHHRGRDRRCWSALPSQPAEHDPIIHCRNIE